MPCSDRWNWEEVWHELQYAAPCPFCGNKPSPATLYVYEPPCLHCQWCLAIGPQGLTVTDAITRWNKRNA